MPRPATARPTSCDRRRPRTRSYRRGAVPDPARPLPRPGGPRPGGDRPDGATLLGISNCREKQTQHAPRPAPTSQGWAHRHHLGDHPDGASPGVIPNCRILNGLCHSFRAHCCAPTGALPRTDGRTAAHRRAHCRAPTGALPRTDGRTAAHRRAHRGVSIHRRPGTKGTAGRHGPATRPGSIGPPKQTQPGRSGGGAPRRSEPTAIMEPTTRKSVASRTLGAPNGDRPVGRASVGPAGESLGAEDEGGRPSSIRGRRDAASSERRSGSAQRAALPAEARLCYTDRGADRGRAGWDEG